MSAPNHADVRCPSCRRLLAKRLDNGAAEIRRGGHVVAVVYVGEVACTDCDVSVPTNTTARPPDRNVIQVAVR